MRLTVHQDPPSYLGYLNRTRSELAGIPHRPDVDAPQAFADGEWLMEWNIPVSWEELGDRLGSGESFLPTDIFKPDQAGAAAILLQFISKLSRNIQAAPAEAHRELADRPWDFL